MPAPSATISKLKTEATLADSGLADNPNYPTIALDRVCEFSFKSSKLVVSPD